MGFYRKLNDKEDVSGGSEADSLEEQYQKMFKKMARDFVFKDDLRAIFNFIFEDLIDNDEEFDTRYNAAVLKAIEYRDNLSKPLKDRKKYKDVIDDE
jgi:hypothetical protein